MEDNPPSLGNLRLLPGEIRNIIYDLATLPETEPIALLRANLRSLYGPLLLVSRQFHQEAYQFYREACLRFWTDHDFEVILPSYVPGAKDKAIKDTSNIIRTVGKIRDADLQQIRNLTVRTPRQVFTLHDAAGLWRISSRLSGHIGNQWYVVRHACEYPGVFHDLYSAQRYLESRKFHPQIHGTIKEQVVCFVRRHLAGFQRRERSIESFLSMLSR